MASAEVDPTASRVYEGRQFGGYRVARTIAKGGMATIFLARKSGPGRFTQNAAIKIIHPHLAETPRFVSMFLDEAAIVSSINHPNVCRVLDSGEAEGAYFLAFEYVRGETWTRTLEGLRASQEGAANVANLAAYVVGQACEGLHAAHGARGPDGSPLNVVHRDVSPDNLFVAYDGSVRVIDFGVASAANRSVAPEDAGKGRYAYMAPEQMGSGAVDCRADVWSLGVVLREALEAKHPFLRDTDAATMYAVREEPMPDWNEEVPQALRSIVDRALSRERDERYASARELGSALGNYLGGLPELVAGPELSRFMRAMFKDEIAAKRALLRGLALTAGVTPSTSTEVPIMGEDTASRVLTRDPSPSVSEVRLVHDDVSPEQTELEESHAPQSSGRVALWAAALLVMAAVGGVWGIVHRTPSASPAVAGGSLEPATTPATLVEPPAAPAAPAAPVAPAVPLAVPPSGDTQGAAEAAATAPSEAPARKKSSSERKRRSNAPQEGTGTLVVGAGSGWAEVFLDGRNLGTTPVRKSLPAGTHRLVIRPYGQKPERKQRVTVTADEVTKLRLKL